MSRSDDCFDVYVCNAHMFDLVGIDINEEESRTCQTPRAALVIRANAAVEGRSTKAAGRDQGQQQ